MFCSLRVGHICNYHIVKAAVFARILDIPILITNNISVLIMLNEVKIGRICQTVFHMNVAVSITGKNHIHFCDASRVGNFVPVNRIFTQNAPQLRIPGINISLDIAERFNQEAAGPAKRVVYFLSYFRINKTHHCFDNMARRKVFS